MSAGYSGTPLARKLGIREGHHVLIVGPPTDLDSDLQPVPPSVRVTETGATVEGASGQGAKIEPPTPGMPDERYDVVLLFSPDARALREHFPSAVRRLRWDGGLWACWPKKSSPLYVDLARDEVREVGLDTGLVDNKVCAVNDDWSGLRFVVRTNDRPKGGGEGGPSV